MKTEVLWYLGERSIELREVEIPEPRAHEVLVEIEMCGMCSWDLLSFAGNLENSIHIRLLQGMKGWGV